MMMIKEEKKQNKTKPYNIQETITEGETITSLIIRNFSPFLLVLSNDSDTIYSEEIIFPLLYKYCSNCYTMSEFKFYKVAAVVFHDHCGLFGQRDRKYR